jgi:hypothetical protein
MKRVSASLCTAVLLAACLAASGSSVAANPNCGSGASLKVTIIPIVHASPSLNLLRVPVSIVIRGGGGTLVVKARGPRAGDASMPASLTWPSMCAQPTGPKTFGFQLPISKAGHPPDQGTWVVTATISKGGHASAKFVLRKP